MKGLIFWANSYCRSTLSFFMNIGIFYNVPYKIFILNRDTSLRTSVGFSDTEFSNVDISYLDFMEALSLMESFKDFNHIFCSYQKAPLYQKMMLYAIQNKIKYCIASEAPCNMTPFPQRILKSCYVNFILPVKLREIIHHADFIINFSGDEKNSLKHLGWKNQQIIPCGYYSPPIPESNLIQRTETNWKNFTILLTGIHQWHRSSILLLRALNILKKRKIIIECVITQEGPLFEKLQKYAVKHELTNVRFKGFVSMKELTNLYENCSVFVGSGSNEPWAMRLNDALQCGAPLIVNGGTGGKKLVYDFDCGIVFKRNKPNSLAQAIEKMVTDRNFYLKIARNATQAAKSITPEQKAKQIASLISSNFTGWGKDTLR